MEKKDFLSEDDIRDNFFGLSFTGQIKIFNFYLEILENYGSLDKYNFFNDVFSKYINVISRFCDFKSNINCYDDETIEKIRQRIIYLKSRITPNNYVSVDDFIIESDIDIQIYYPNKITDTSVDKYIYDLYSYSKDKLVEICVDLAFYYSDINKMNFKERLGLCNGNRDFFNSDIRKLSGDFYSLYYSMGIVERMIYIWHLSFYDSLFIDENYEYDDAIMFVNNFSNDDGFINPVDSDFVRPGANRKVLSKFFKF